jgi:hypothetical protein
MACGHAANGHDPQGNPVCAICAGIDPGAAQAVEKPDLAGRTARCLGCRNNPPSATPSAWSLPFFEYRLDHPFDRYDCGCYGWD